MANTPEAKVKQQAVKVLKELGVYYFFPATHGYGRSGIPDIICCFKGRFIAIECKAGKTKIPTALQIHEIKMISDAGGLSFVVNDANIASLRGYLLLL